MKAGSHRLASAVSVLVWSATILYFCASGRINAYLVPGFRAYAVFGGLVLAVIGLFALLTHRHETNCGHEDCDGHHDGGDIPPIGILACMTLPLLATSSLARDSFSLRALVHKGAFDETPALAVSPFSSPGVPSRESLETTRPRNERGAIVLDLLEIHFSATDAEYARNMEDLRVAVQGRVLSAAASPTGSAVVYRLLLTCCAADGRPLSVRVALPETPASPPENSWAEIEGVLTYEDGGKGGLTPVIRGERLTPLEAPAEEYLLRY